MKRINLILTLLPILAFANINTPMNAPIIGNVTVVQPQNDKELAWVDEQIAAILPTRIGVADGYINSLLDPVKYVRPSIPASGGSKLLAPPSLRGLSVIPKIVEEPLRLQALMNKSALINGKWYSLNAPVRGYRLSEIKVNSVLLSAKKGQPLVLFLSKTNTNIKLNTK